MKPVFLIVALFTYVQMSFGQENSYINHEIKMVKVKNSFFLNILDTIIEYEVVNFQFDFKDTLLFEIDLKNNDSGSQIYISKIENKNQVYAIPDTYFIYRSGIFFVHGENKSLFRLQRFYNKKFTLRTKREILPYPLDIVDWIYLYDGKEFTLQFLNEFRK